MDPIIGQIQAFGFNFAPRGWAHCDGQLLPIAQNTALFSLLGTNYGGDGRTTFGLPDLRGRSIVHVGNGPGLSNITWGHKGGNETTTLNASNMPAHSHALQNGTANVKVETLANGPLSEESDNGSGMLGTSGSMPAIYAETAASTDFIGGVTISGNTSNAGSSASFDNRSPYLGIYVSIALQGIYPSRS